MRAMSGNRIKHLLIAVASAIILLALCPTLALAGEAGTSDLTAGTVVVGVEGEGDNATDLSASSSTAPKNISKALVSVHKVTYNGKAQKPKVTVTYNGKTLKEGTDYTVSYKNNVEMGEATAIVKGKGGYTGSKSETFWIVGKPFYAGATSMPVSSKSTWTLKNCRLCTYWGEDVVSVKGNVVTAKKAGVAKILIFDQAGSWVASRTVTVYELSGKYVIQSCMKGKSNMCLDMNGASKANGAQMIVWGKNGGLNQQFTFELQKDGSYMVKSVNSGKYLDVNGASKAWGCNVIQWQRNGNKNQRWRIEVDTSNRITFVSVNSGLVFDVNGGKADWGANMIQWGSNGGLNQKWKLVKAPKYIVYTSEFRFTIPSYWRGKVYWVNRKNDEGRPVVCIYPNGMPATKNYLLASVQAVSKDSPSATNGGDYVSHRVCKVEKGSKAIVVWSKNWTAERATYYYIPSYSGQGQSYDEFKTLVDLSSGGEASLAKVAQNPSAYMNTFYDYKFLNKYLKPTIVVQ